MPRRRSSAQPAAARLRKLVDERRQYEIIPNGHSSFLTKAAQKRMLEGTIDDMERSTLEPLSDRMLSDARRRSLHRIPEPASEYGAGREIVTLRLRALPGRSIPDLGEVPRPSDCFFGLDEFDIFWLLL